MAVSNSEKRNVMFFKLNGKADKDSTPRFWRQEKIGDKWQSTESFDTVSGVLTGASIKRFNWEGSEKVTFHFELTDAYGVCAVDMAHNQCAYSIINSLAGIQPGQEVKIQVYKKTNKETGKIYPGAVVKDMTGNLTKWAVAPADMPKSDPVMVNGKQYVKEGKPQWDDTKVKAFWEEMFTTKVVANCKSFDPDADIPYAPASALPEPSVPDDMPF